MLIGFDNARLEQAYQQYQVRSTLEPLDHRLQWMFCICYAFWASGGLLAYFTGLRASLAFLKVDAAYLAVIVVQLVVTTRCKAKGNYARRRNIIVGSCRIIYVFLGLMLVPHWSRLSTDDLLEDPAAFLRYFLVCSGIFFQNWLAVGLPLPLKWHLPLQLLSCGMYSWSLMPRTGYVMGR